jgi:hypothetical protein
VPRSRQSVQIYLCCHLYIKTLEVAEVSVTIDRQGTDPKPKCDDAEGSVTIGKHGRGDRFTLAAQRGD